MLEEKNSLVTVIVPVYNTEKYIARCIESIINQSYKEIEIILINDGSEDRSEQICNDYVSKDNRIVVINQKNQGVSVARNQGILNAKGKYLIFVDSDDTVDLNCIKDFVDILEKYSCNIVFGGFQICGEDNYCIKGLTQLCDKTKFLLDAYLNSQLKLLLATSTCTLFVTQIISDNNIAFSEILVNGEDGNFTLDYLSVINEVYVIEKVYYNYYVFKQEERISTTKYVYPNQYEFYIDYFEKLYGQLVELELREKTMLLDKFFDGLIFNLVMLVAYGNFYGVKELFNRLNKVITNPLVNLASQYYTVKNKENSRCIPFFIKRKKTIAAFLFIKLHAIKYAKKNKVKTSIKSIFRT